MKARRRSLLLLALTINSLAAQSTLSAQSVDKPNPGELFIKDFTTGPDWFPHVIDPYRPQPFPAFSLENSQRLRDLIHDGKLELSLADAMALALENNLDIAVQRHVLPIAQTDVLRTRSGQAARGFQGASIPGGLSAGALGAGVSAASSSGGVGAAGGITGGGGAVVLGPSGSFDPSFVFNFSWDRVTSPLNTLQVAGVPAVTTYSTAITSGYAQMFPTGTSYFVGLNGVRQSSTQQFLRFNPAVVTRFTAGFHQPLLNGFGLLSNQRFLLVAQNNRRVSEDVFRMQVINTIVKVENTYWDLAAFQESVKVAEQSLGVAEKLLRDNKARSEIGVMAPLDVTSAESEVAGRQRDLIVARTNLQLQETTFKNVLSKLPSPELDAARIITTDALPQARENDLPDVDKALASASENRPELRQSITALQNQNIAVRHTDSSLKPSFAVFGMYAGAGLEGNSNPTTTGGAGGSLAQAFGADFPEQAGGASLSIPLRNRSAQADDLRAHFERSQLEISLQRTRNQISLEVRQAVIGLIQGKAQLEAARQAVNLGQQTLDAEQKKLEAGVSTSYQEILRERDLFSAQQAEVQANAAYAKALVELDRATGTTLDQNGISLSDAITGTITSMPKPSFSLAGPKKTTTGGK